MRWPVWLLFVVVACTRTPPPAPPELPAPASIEVFDEDGRPTLKLAPQPDSSYALIDFTGRTFGTLSTGASSTARDFQGNPLALVTGDRVLDGAGTAILTAKRDGARTTFLQSDGHAAFTLDDDGEVTRDGVPVIAPIKVRGTELRAIGRVLALGELPLEVRLVVVGAYVLR